MEIKDLYAKFSPDKEITQADILGATREKYPQYADVPDQALAKAMSTTKPEDYGFLKQFDQIGRAHV